MILYSKSLSDYFGQFPRKRHEIINFGQFWDISFSTLRDNINTPYPVADLSGGRGVSPACTPHAQNVLNFMQFLENFGKIIGWCPLLRGILDPPLIALLWIKKNLTQRMKLVNEQDYYNENEENVLDSQFKDLQLISLDNMMIM